MKIKEYYENAKKKVTGCFKTKKDGNCIVKNLKSKHIKEVDDFILERTRAFDELVKGAEQDSFNAVKGFKRYKDFVADMEKQGKIFGKDFNLFDVLNDKDRLLFLESKDKTFKEMQEFQNEILVKMKKSFRQKKMTILSASILFGGLLFVAGASLFQHLRASSKK